MLPGTPCSRHHHKVLQTAAAACTKLCRICTTIESPLPHCYLGHSLQQRLQPTPPQFNPF